MLSRGRALLCLLVVLVGFAAATPRIAAAQFGCEGLPSCEYDPPTISFNPAGGSYTGFPLTSTLSVQVSFCDQTGISTYTFSVTLNGSDVTGQFSTPTYGLCGQSSGAITLGQGANQLVVTICDDWVNCGSSEVTYTYNTYFNVSTAFTNNDNQDLALCAASCFSAVHAQSTVPYISLDQPRSLTLVYHGDRVALRPFIYADVSLGTGHPASPQRYWLEAKINNATVTFLNNETRLRFSIPTPTSTTVRLAGQFDATPYVTNGTGAYTLQIVVGVDYATTTESRTIATKLLLVDERKSPIARGWTIAGLQRIYPQTDGSVVLTEGDGSALYFAYCGPGCFKSPDGEYSRLTASGSGSAYTYTRAYVDSAKARFDNVGRLTHFITRLHDTTAFEYDGSGRLSRVRDPYRLNFSEKASLVLFYGQYGLAQIYEQLKNGSGRHTYVTVAADSTLRVIKDPDGDSTRFAYDASRRLATIVNRRRDSTIFVYDAASWKVTRVDLPKVAIDAGSGTTVLATPSVTLRPWQTVGVPTTSTSSTPAAAARVDTIAAVITSPEGDVTRFTVDRWGAPLTVTDPVGGTTTITRQNTLVTGVTLPWGEQLVYGYGPAPLVTAIWRTGQSTLNLQYDAFAQVKKVWGTNYATRDLFRGARGRLDSVRVAGVTTARYYYDSRFRVDSVRDGANHTTKVTYDFGGTGNVTRVTLDGGRYAIRRFDLYGRDSVNQSVTQPNRVILYDAMNRVTRYVDGVNADTTLFTYDPLFLLRVRDPKGQVARWEVNALGWKTREYDPADTLTRFLSFRHDRNGRLTSYTNRRGETVDLRYDRLGRVVSKRGTNVVADSFAYSADHRRLVGINAVSLDSIFLSSALFPDSVVTRLGGQRFRLHYRANPTFQLDSIGIATASGITFANRRYYWNPAHEQLDSVRVGTALVKFTRTDDRWDDTTMFPGRIKRIDSYTSLHAPYQTKFDDPDHFPSSVEFSLWRGYATDSLGRIRHVVLLGNRHQEFAYDSLGRLTRQSFDQDGSTSCSAGNVTYGYTCPATYDSSRTATYDAAGNLLWLSSQIATRTYDPGNRVSAVGNQWYEHDADGNIRRRFDNVYPSILNDVRFVWSADGRLLSDSSASTGAAVQYDYNAFGQLVRKRRNGIVSRYFLWQGDQLLAELDSSATRRVAEYAYYPGIDRPLALVTGAQSIAATRYFQQDALGNVIAIFGADGSLPLSISYNPWFGTAESVAGALADTSRLRWKGLLWEDDVAQLYYVRNRWFDPGLGRFLSEDPIGLAGGLNLYTFADGDPVGGSDPYGLIGLTPAGILPFGPRHVGGQLADGPPKGTRPIPDAEGGGSGIDWGVVRRNFWIGCGHAFDPTLAGDTGPGWRSGKLLCWFGSFFGIRAPVGGALTGTRVAVPVTAAAVKTFIPEGEMLLVVVKDGKVIAQTADYMLSHQRLLERALGTSVLSEGVWVGTVGKLGGRINFLNSQTFYGQQSAAPEAIQALLNSLYR